jgi:hypothetical protein
MLISADGKAMARVIRLWQGENGPRAGPPLRDDRFIPVIEAVRRADMLGQPFLVPLRFTPRYRGGCEDVKRSLYNAARYYCSCGAKYCTRKHDNLEGCPEGGQRVSCRADIVRDGDGHLRVQFRFFDKKEAIRAVVQKYGPDPSNWPYQARAKKVKA